MKIQMIIGSMNTALVAVMERVDNTYNLLSNSELYSDYISPTVLDRLAGDIELIRKANVRFNKRPDSGTEHDLYNCICVFHDRLDLIFRRIHSILDKDSELVEDLKDVLELTRCVRSKFIFDTRGRDTTNDVIDKDGEPHRRNMHIKLEHQRILDQGRLSEID